MPYALFSDDAKLSKSYPTEADVWKLAADSGLVTDVEAKTGQPTPRRMLDNDYEIRPCQAEAGECPEKNERDARAEEEFQQLLKGRAA
ncbi:hypothetical protein FNL55_11015 [Tardiphaga sp. vice352]|uniref:hypothetical protein n=2 Tax=Tardiphaga TaxID=1395974 RepID=UPI001162855A|nr:MULTISPECIES: hypothetical protein [unclassified Tardiphaga]QDM16512.1 hypothetical protein FNL53_11705 [Tardiphaga sp. vice278]QDM21537.1 hypothetical protein FIU28_10605 [Tardiphaga sp. vice154]QDM31786.1 hypothetical protein FNL55_11015 [Tardiphaga sp. vice352]